MDLSLEIQKTDFGIRISFLDIPTICANFQSIWRNLIFSVQICPKMDFKNRNFKNLSPDSELTPPRYHACQFSGKTENFDFFRPNLPKDGFWDQNIKNLSPDSESAPPRYLERQFSAKTNNFELFGINLGKLPIYVQYFGSNNVEGVAESWMEAEMSWVEVDGAR